MQTTVIAVAIVMQALIFFGLVFGGFLIWTNVKLRKEERDGNWWPCDNHTEMRRWTNGHWEYRRMTPAEEHEKVSKDAW